MGITRVTWTDWAGEEPPTTGTVVNNAQLQAIYDSIEAAFTWTAVSFSAGNFTGNGSMTWTVASGDVQTNSYIKIGRTMIWTVQLNNTTVGGTPAANLQITIPGGFTAASNQSVKCSVVLDNNVVTGGHARVSGGTVVAILRDDFGNWSASTDQTSIYFTIIIQTTA